ncbi:16S rRNA (cytosine(1402)-N(4))-methyltransferase, partial [bacterium]
MEFKKTGGAPAGEAPEGETFYHLPVLLNETVSLLVTSKEGVYIDGTL